MGAYEPVTHMDSRASSRPWWCRILEIQPTATTAEIRAAYRKKSKTHHPDAGGSSGMMQLLNDAKGAALKIRGEQ